MSTIEFPTTTMKLRVLDGASPLTWDEARRLAHCRIVWKACKRAEEKAIERETAERREWRRLIFWWAVVVIGALTTLGGLIFLAETEVEAMTLLVACIGGLAASIYFTNKLDGR